MANRNNTFLLKRSNIAGKVPAAGSLLLGELGLNIADVILYASGTTANSILPIGWDRVARTGDTMTGTLFAPSISATTISAETIVLKNYIDFNTGTTSPTNISGRVFYDNQSHSLAYFPDINQNVKIEVGQQLYIRGFNNTGSVIPKGTVLSIQSATNGLPNFTPAVNVHSENSQVIGLAASDISINENGLALSQGILSGITVNTFSVGDILYSSPFSAGTYVANTNSFPFSARTNQIGFVIATGTSTGQIYVNINNEDENLTLTDIERNILEGNVISTGVYEFTGITTYSTTTVNVAPMRGWIVRNTYTYATLPDVINLYYSGGTNISLPNIGTSDSTYLLVNSGSTLYQQTTFPTPQERRENIYLGKINHPNRSTISSVNNNPDFDVSPMSALRDLWTPLKLINQGIIVSPNGANLNINTSAGTLWGNGIGWVSNQNNPDSVNISGTSPTTFQYRVQTGGTFSNTTTIDVSHYDLNGIVTSIGGGGGSSTNQRVYLFPTGLVRIQYGQTVYGTFAEAVAAVQTETFIEYGNHRDNAILIGVISVNKSASLLNNTSQAKFTLVSKFGELLGGTGGLSTTTLQQAYDNSTTPEITINSTLDGLSIKNGTGGSDITTRLLEGLNAAGNATSFIRADGDISGTTLQTNGFTGNSTGMSALTVNIRTVGSGTPITNLGVDILGNVVSGTTGGSTFTGGTVTGPTNFTNGLTANTISATTIKTPSFTANNGGITATTVSATTYYGLPIDVYSTGGTYNGGNIYVTNNTGGTFTITGLTASGFSANYYGSFSDSTNQPVSGVNISSVWTYNTTELSNGISIVNGSQIKVANKGVYEIGYSAQIEKTQGTDAAVTIWASINGVPVTRSSSITSLVANSALQLPFVSYIFELNANDYVEFYFSSPSQHVQLSTFSGLTTPTRPNAPSVIIVAKQVGLSVTNNLSGDYLPLSGGTVTGGTIFNNGLTANTISATTYYNLPTDIRVTGGTYSSGTATFTNNTGGTFTVSGFLTGMTDTYVTGATYSNNTFTYTNNTGGTFNVLFNTMTGLTINGNLTVTGGTQSLFSGNSSVELVKIIQNGSGDAFVVEDIANGDASHFVINSSGNTAIGLTQPLGSDKLTVSGNTSIYGGLTATTLSSTSGIFSGSGQSILTVIGSGNSTTSPIFSIQGSQGELFSVTDSLTGSLFSVNDISGLPILEVFSDNTTLMGSYQAPSLNTTTKVTLTAGTNTIYSIPTSAYTGAFFDYTVISSGSTGARAGNIMAIWSGTTTQYSETSTNDIGNTAGITFSVAVSGNNAVLSSSATTAGWTLKTIIRTI